MAKTLKFDVTLLTGTFEKNLKNCIGGLKNAWKTFGQDMKNSRSFLDASNAIYMFGKNGVESVTKLFHPYEALVGKVLAVGAAIHKVCKNFEQMEKNALRASRAFKGGGVAKNFDRHKKHLEEATAGGVGNTTEAMGVIADARRESPWLSSKEIDKSIDLAKDLSAALTGDYSEALQKILKLQSAESVSLQDLTDVGLAVDKSQWRQIDGLNNVYKRKERNIIITEMLAKAHADAAKEEERTFGGMMKRIYNQFENFKTKLGEALVPIVKPFYKIGEVIMNIALGFVKPFVAVGKAIGSMLSPITDLLSKSGKLATTIGSMLALVVAFMAKGLIVKSVTTILGLLFNFTNPIGWIVTGLMLVSTYQKEIVEGFKQGIGEERFERLKEILKEVGEAMMDLGATAMEWFADSGLLEMLSSCMQSLFEGIGEIVGWLVDTFNWARDKMNEFAKTVAGFINWISKKLGYGEQFDLSAFDTSGKPPKRGGKNKKDGKDGEKDKDDNPFTDPREQMSATFEDAASMTKRIQQSVASKENNDPQFKMCDYLNQINQNIAKMTEGQRVQTQATQQQLELTTQGNATLKSLNMGFE